METKNIRLKTLIAAIAVILALEAAGAAARTFGNLNLALMGAVRLLDIFCLPAVVFLLEKNLSCIGIYRAGIFSAFHRGLLWSIGFGLFLAIAALVLMWKGISPTDLIKVQLPADIPSLLLFFLVGGIVGPVAEEIFFRGLVFRFFRRWGFLFSLFFSTAIFVAMHPTTSGIRVPQLVGGLLFGAAFEVEKNLVVPILIHILGNLTIFSFSIIFF